MSPPAADLRLARFVLGPYETNCYVVSSGHDPACWVVDVGFEPGPLIDHVLSSGLRPERVILTHAHLDHIAGLGEFRRRFPGVPVWVHEAEREWLSDPELNLSAFAGLPVSHPGPEGTLHHGDTLNLGPSTWSVRHTPGHSPGSITLWCESANLAIVGDTLFAGSVGRTDFPGCSQELLSRSIRTQLYTLPLSTRVFPGHGEPTTIGHERATNPFVRGA